jgi:shikimate dehydrogenase
MRRVALIGHPLRRRHSEVMHNAAFAARGIDARYELRDIGPDELGPFVGETRSPEWYGFQITAPYKQAVVEHLDGVEEAARLIGAVNSVERRDDGSLVGFNTDAPGFRTAVEEQLGVDLAGAAVTVAGAGGVAHAIVYALLDAGASRVVIGARRHAAADRLAGRYPDADGRVQAASLGDDAFADALATSDLAVNATTVGMTSAGTSFPVAALPDGAAVFDCVYIPAETELVREARARGLRAANGAAMLVRQAVIAFERWTGIGDVEEVMAASIEPLLREASEA